MCWGNKMKEGSKPISLFFPNQQLGEKGVWEVPRKPNGASQLPPKWLHILQKRDHMFMLLTSTLQGSCYFHFLVKKDNSGRLVKLGSGHRVHGPFESPAKGVLSQVASKMSFGEAPSSGISLWGLFLVEDFVHPAQVQLCSKNLMFSTGASRRVSVLLTPWY